MNSPTHFGEGNLDPRPNDDSAKPPANQQQLPAAPAIQPAQRPNLLRRALAILNSVEAFTFDAVLAAEHEYVMNRREPPLEIGAEDKAADARVAEGATPNDNLTALALSGGGIRSATVCLGVLQGLADLGLLKRFDYLSTVSGGGYIGAWLSAWIHREAEPSEEKSAQENNDRRLHAMERVESQLCSGRAAQASGRPGQAKDLSAEPQPIFHLRNYSNYLAPKLGLNSPDVWVMLAIYIRNLLLNQTVLLSLLAIVIVGVRILVLTYAAQSSEHLARIVSAMALICFALVWGTLFVSLIKMYQRSVAPKIVAMPTDIRRYVQIVIALVTYPLIIGTCCLCWFFVYPQGTRFQLLLGPEICNALSSQRYCLDFTFAAAGFVLWGVSYILFRISLRSSIVLQFWLHRGEDGYKAALSSGNKAFRTWSNSCPGIQPVVLRWLVWASIGGLIGFILASLRAISVSDFLKLDALTRTPPGHGLFVGALVTLGPPLIWCILLLFAILQQGLYSKLVREEDREWTASIASWLLATVFRWSVLFGLVIFGPIALLHLGPEIQSLLASGWVVTTLGGVLAGKSGQTSGSGRNNRLLEAIAQVAPYVFMIGLVIGMACVVGEFTHHRFEQHASACQVEPGPQKIAAEAAQKNQAIAFHLSIDAAVKADGIVHRIDDSKAALELKADVFPAPETTECQSKIAAFAQTNQAYLGDLVGSSLKTVKLDPPDTILCKSTEAVNELAWCELGEPFCWIGGLLGCALLLSITIGVNTFSLQRFYRNRLVRCYLGASRNFDQSANGETRFGALCNANPPPRRPEPITGFAPHDDLDLAELARLAENQWNPGPYHLINTALNLVEGEDLAWQERKAASFVMSPFYCGCDLTGYRPTSEFADGITLGSAVAISGSALAPNMGYHSSPAVTALLTFFNVRLGGWLGNPRVRSRWKSREPWNSLALLLKEMFGHTNRRSNWIYLSDGGHFDNLGIYELVRRRVRFIVVCDAGADPDFTFADLGGVVRKCRSDFGVPIDIDLGPLHPQADGRSKWHCAVGVIHYENANPEWLPGILVFLKSSLTGDESSDVLNYAVEHPPFPHESTLEQFFTESQFEAYRALGQHIAQEVFTPAMRDLILAKDPTDHREDKMTDRSHIDIAFNLFRNLRHHWTMRSMQPSAEFLESVRDYLDFIRRFRNDPTTTALAASIYPELTFDEPPAGAETKAEPPPDDSANRTQRTELASALEMLQIMEEGWVNSEFDGQGNRTVDRGWMNMMRRWSQSSLFRHYWLLLRSEFSQEFIRFCEDELNADRGHPKLVEISTDTAGVVRHLFNDSFQVEWPHAGQDWKLETIGAADTKPQLGDSMGWVIHLQRSSVPDAGPELPVGFLLLRFVKPIDPKEPARNEFEILLWIAPPFRHLGIGTAILRQFLFVRKQCENLLRRFGVTGDVTLKVRYPHGNLVGEYGRERRDAWCNFFQYFGFRELRDRNSKQDKDDLVLYADTMLAKPLPVALPPKLDLA